MIQTEIELVVSAHRQLIGREHDWIRLNNGLGPLLLGEPVVAMGPHVDLEVALLSEELEADAALEGFDSQVLPQMNLEP